MKIIEMDDSDMVKQLLSRVEELERKVNVLQGGHRQTLHDDLIKQNDVSKKGLESAFGIRPDGTGVALLDGLLNDYVDPKQNSQELIRSVRDQ